MDDSPTAGLRGRPDRLGFAILLLCCACLLGIATGPLSAQSIVDSVSYSGRPLAEALLELRAQGLRIVFTSKTVSAQMMVEEEPTATTARGVLDQILAPHGLVSRDGPSGSVVVVARSRAGPEPLWISGLVRTRDGEKPIAGVELRLVESEARALTGTNGRFRLETPGPGVFSLDARRRGFVIEHLTGVHVVRGDTSEIEIILDPAPVTEEQVIVTPSRVSLMRQQPSAPLALSRDDILALPHLGGDFFRALSLLPGVSSNDVSAEFHVRGGRSDETQILLDGQELYESYHLKDFENALSVVSTTTLDSVDLSTGGFPVEHGDRMSGVLDMTSRTPTGPRRTQVGVSVLNLNLGSAGIFAEGRGSWLAQGRRGAIDLVSELLGPENPQYWDAFGKLDYQLTSRQSVRANILHSSDELEFEETSIDGFKSRATQYQSTYLWLTHQTILSDFLLVESAVSRSRIDRDRRGLEIEDDVQFDITDLRELEVLGLRQDWNWRASPKHHLKWGFGLRNFEATYDYDGFYDFDNPLAVIRQNPEAVETLFEGLFEADHDNGYIADRVSIGETAALEVGLRYDRHTLTGESLWSPRVNLSINLAPSSVLRASWGRFTQSQRPYELQVEDGESAFNKVERSEHQVLGVEHFFPGSGDSLGLALRAEIYRREVSNPLRRFENLYEPINNFPEVEPDRVEIAPERSRAQGLEVFLRSRHQRFGWWLNYTYSETEDEIDGSRAPRRFDQPHALNVDFDYRMTDHWTLNLAWRFHTGWPTTPLTLEETLIVDDDDEGSELLFVPVLGPRFSSRLPDYHRLDLRASREWQSKLGAVTFFIDIQNAYDRGNVSGYDFDIDEEEGILITNQEEWARILPSIGVSIEF